MFQYKTGLSLYHLAAQSDYIASGQGISKKRHAEPDGFHRTGDIFNLNRGYLHLPIWRYLHLSVDNTCNRLNLPFLKLTYGNGFLINIISSGIIPQQITYRIYTDFCKKFFRFFAMTLLLFTFRRECAILNPRQQRKAFCKT